MHKNIVILVAAFVLMVVLEAKAQGGPFPCDGPHEGVRCVQECPPDRTCANRGIEYDCAEQPAQNCKNRCVCDDGYYRNSDYQCVTFDDCGCVTNP